MSEEPRLPASPMSDTEPNARLTVWRWWAGAIAGVLLLGYGLSVWGALRVPPTYRFGTDLANALLDRGYLLLLAVVLVRLMWPRPKGRRFVAFGLRVIAAAYLVHTIRRGAAEEFDPFWTMLEIPRGLGALLLLALPSSLPEPGQRLWQNLASSLVGVGLGCEAVWILANSVRYPGTWAIYPPFFAFAPYIIVIACIIATVYLVHIQPYATEDGGPEPSLREQAAEVTAWFRRRIAEAFS